MQLTSLYMLLFAFVRRGQTLDHVYLHTPSNPLLFFLVLADHISIIFNDPVGRSDVTPL